MEIFGYGLYGQVDKLRQNKTNKPHTHTNTLPPPQTHPHTPHPSPNTHPPTHTTHHTHTPTHTTHHTHTPTHPQCTHTTKTEHYFDYIERKQISLHLLLSCECQTFKTSKTRFVSNKLPNLFSEFNFSIILSFITFNLF